MEVCMDSELFKESVEYERLTQAVYQAILRKEGQNIEVVHNQDVTGKSGVAHQVDVLWRFKLAGVTHLVLIECKNYASTLTLEKVRNFFAVLHDIGNCGGLMVTRTGYQSGVEQFAKFYGIGLKLLRRPEPEDWIGRIKNIHINIQIREVVSSEDRPIRVKVQLEAKDANQETYLNELQAKGRLSMPSALNMVFWSSDRKNMTEELRWWLPKQLTVAEKADGGPYKEVIPLNDKYLLINPGSDDEVFIKVNHLEVEYFVETIDNTEMVLLGEDLVETILKDFNSGDVEYTKLKKE